ncbi:hypothetical protein SCUCBS95973_007569 [Sporothrix curviconia]|uniref:Ribosomal RNA-processing protein 1 n=1 Tax=Sporothrix curviconia TaxID=1260050 RepID=A0ABP0CES8_9PEZI
MASATASMPFIKNLASSDRKIRTAALDSLKGFLTAKYAASSAASSQLTFHDAQKLWAGLFYALWMADRAPAQQRLCDELAGLPAAVRLSDPAVDAWLRAFWATMAREWTTGIDVLRMEKFMLLVRRVLNAQLAWMAGDSGSGSDGKKPQKAKTTQKTQTTQTTQKTQKTQPTTPAHDLGLEILAQWPFNPEGEAEVEAAPSEDDTDGGDDNNDKETGEARRPRKRSRKVVPTVHIPVGLTMHAVDIWVDEAEKLGLLTTAASEGESQSEDTPSLAKEINALVETLAAKTTAPAVRQRTREALEDERLPWVESTAAPEQAVGGGGIEGQADSDDDDDAAADGDWDGFND